MQNWPEVHPLNSPTLPPATTTNCLIMESGDEIFLIDPAANTKKSQAHIDYILEEALGEKSDRKIKIVLTHHHVDHCGDAERLREKFDFEIWAHEINVKQKLIDFELDKLIGRNKYLDDSRNIQIHHTPGHAVGHLCFFDERSKVLIAGDMVASEGLFRKPGLLN